MKRAAILLALFGSMIGCSAARDFARGAVAPDLAATRAEVADALQGADEKSNSLWELLGILAGGGAVATAGAAAARRGTTSIKRDRT